MLKPFSKRYTFSSNQINQEKTKKPAVFIDRDGTIIEQVELLSSATQLRIFHNSAPAIRILNKLGYLVVIVTNQPVVARGIIGPQEIDQIHSVLIQNLASQGAIVDVVYFCPHHPEANLEKFRGVCLCRKPNPGMILLAAKEYCIDLKKSFMIGDSTQDVAAGNRADIRTILVQTGHGGGDIWQHNGRIDFHAKDIGEAVEIIRNQSCCSLFSVEPGEA
jgi:histidinol-phosphate phosphatase family protein